MNSNTRRLLGRHRRSVETVASVGLGKRKVTHKTGKTGKRINTGRLRKASGKQPWIMNWANQ